MLRLFKESGDRALTDAPAPHGHISSPALVPPPKPTEFSRLSWGDRDFLRIIQHQGVAETHLDQLQIPGTAAMVAAAQTLAAGLPSTQGLRAETEDDFGGHCVHADSAEIATNYPEIIAWALNERLLDLAEQQIGCAPAFIGVALRKDSPNGQQVGTRLWHVDGEDKQVFKILVYLNDVDANNGPFEYVPKNCFNARYRRLSLKYHRHWQYYCKNEDLAKMVPVSQWRAATGPAGTVLLADTTSVFHHGAIAQSGERLALIFAYTSQRPRDRSLCERFFPRADLLAAIAPRFSPRQQDCLLNWRRSR